VKVYLAKFYLGEKVAYKVGLTKWYIVEKRFADEQYNVFDKIEIIDDIYITHSDAMTARTRCEFVEGILKAVFKKNFRLESYFEKPDDYFTGLSGITEMFILPQGMSEQHVIDVFRDVKKFVQREYESGKYYD
jgi:hypothetical protein